MTCYGDVEISNVYDGDDGDKINNKMTTKGK